MYPLIVTLSSIIAFYLAYRFYARYISKKIFDIDPSRPTPANTMEDGVDYVPTNRYVLFGHHFASIAGAAPIIGPAFAVFWGWLPALLWIVFGSIFIGGVHDLGSLVISLRNKGKSIGDICHHLIGKRATIIMQIVIFFMIAVAMGVFVITVTQLFQAYPEVIIPSISLVFIAALVGTLLRRNILTLLPCTIIGLTLFGLSIAAGIQFDSPDLDGNYWKIILLAYALIASILPVWLLLQPRDYINSFQLYIGLLALYIGFFIGAGSFEFAAPAIRDTSAIEGAPGMFPLLFVTIACGAISGFHSLVSSGTTAKQISTEADVQFITYGGMLTEGLMAVIAVIATTVMISGGDTDGKSWSECYSCFVSSDRMAIFVNGGAKFISNLGIPMAIGKTLIGVTIVGFCLTTLDTATRLLRYNISEIGDTLKIKPLANKYAASLIAVGAIAFFAFIEMPVIGADGEVTMKSAGLALWQLFGITNQLLGGLALMTISLYLFVRRKPAIYTALPMVFLLVMTIWALISQLITFLSSKYINWPFVAVSIITIVLAFWMLIEGIIALHRHRKNILISPVQEL